MFLPWVLGRICVFASGIGALQGAVLLQSYILLIVGIGLAAGGAILFTRRQVFSSDSTSHIRR